MLKAYLTMAIALVPGGLAASTLVRQATVGVERICYYEPVGLQRARATRNTEPTVAVGLAEPCPHRYPGPRARRDRAAAVRIPSMATLADTRTRGSRRTCVYRYLGQDYHRTVSASTRCPFTPHFR